MSVKACVMMQKQLDPVLAEMGYKMIIVTEPMKLMSARDAEVMFRQLADYVKEA
jgi:predicted thioredoxin/glutaredoxin